MSLRLVESNAVIVANQFNPSVFNQLWLTKNGLITEAEAVGENCAYTNVLTQIVTDAFVFVVTPNHLQFTLRPGSEASENLVAEKIGKVVDLLPHTPFTAIGLNFHYHLSPEKKSIPVFTRELFFVGTSPLHRAFDCPDARFGGYVSRDMLGFRLKFEVKPIRFQEAGGAPQETVLLGFNYHQDLDSEASGEAIKSAVRNWHSAAREALRIANSLNEKDA